MARKSQRGRDISGILLLDKPGGMTSNTALQKVKRLFDARKAGHTGSLDPLATGMLPICFGAATKLSHFLLDADKSYSVEARFGLQTDTDDADGSVVAEADFEGVEFDLVKAALSALEGEHAQTPPMYSALKHRGRRLYELARQGVEVERKSRLVRIREIELEQFEPPFLRFRLTCSKGTYVRSVVRDLAASLGTLGHVHALRRLSVEPFAANAMHSLAELERRAKRGPAALDGCLLPADTVLSDWPRIVLSADETQKVVHGRTVVLSGPVKPGRHRLYSPDNAFVGIGEVLPGDSLAPKRIFLG